MKSSCLAVLSVVLALTMGSTPLFAGSQRAPDLNTSHHEKPVDIFNTPNDFTNTSLLASTGGAVAAKEIIAEEKEEEMTAAQVGELMANPFSYL